MVKRLTKKQLAEVVASYHGRIMARLKQDEHFAVHQYMGLYFRIFREAYESGFRAPHSYNARPMRNGWRAEWLYTKPLVTATSIWQYAKKQGWVHSEMEGTEKRYEQIHEVMTWWDDWTYAWHQLMHKTRVHRHFL